MIALKQHFPLYSQRLIHSHIDETLPPVSTILETLPDAVMLVDDDDLVVYANSNLKKLLGTESVIGRKTCEVLGCEHLKLSEFEGDCKIQEILYTSRKGLANEDTVDITIDGSEARTMSIHARTTSHEGLNYTILTIEDVEEEKNERFHERHFFHDILNTVGGLKGFAEFLGEAEAEEREEYQGYINSLASKLLEEVKAYQEFTALENQDLNFEAEEISAHNMLTTTAKAFQETAVGVECNLQVEPVTEDFNFQGDRNLMKRILFNLLTNAFEASEYESRVTAGWKKSADGVEFSVHNPEFIPAEAQSRVFEKGFSTKADHGRGYGTYTVKSLVEKYLRGKVSFSSSPESGTTFTVRIPCEAAEVKQSA